jgi:hypothetical protein
MTTPSYLVNPYQPNMPRYIILDISQHTTALRSRLRCMPGYCEVEYEGVPNRNWTEEQIMEMIFGWITYRHEAELQLDYECMSIVDQALGGAFENYADMLARAIADFGKVLLEQLLQFEVYQKGYLFYQFAGWAGRDIILERLHRDQIPFIGKGAEIDSSTL